MSAAPHLPVLLRPLLAACAPVRGVWVDGTFGAGGYAKGLVEAGAEKVVGIDRDHVEIEIDCGKVLRESYQVCVAQKACEPVPGQGASLLVLGATYAQAARYCQWRQMRLPTEAEWERARAMEVLEDLHASSSEWLDGWYTWIPKLTPAQRTQGYFSSRLLLTLHQDKSYRMGGDPEAHIATVAFRCARGGDPRPPKPKPWPIPPP